MIIVRVLLGRGIAAKTTLATSSALPQFAVRHATTSPSGATDTEASEDTTVNMRNLSLNPSKLSMAPSNSNLKKGDEGSGEAEPEA